MTTRAAIYMRQSVTRDDSVSLRVQEDRCRAWCDERGYQVVAVGQDPDTSGRSVSPWRRAGFKGLLGQEWDVLVVYKQDRLVRNFMTFFKVVGELQERGRTIASVSENLDLMTPMGKAQAGILAGMAEQTSADISQRVADARRHLQRQGRVVGGKVVYGWSSVPNPDGPGRVLVRDPERTGWVQAAAQRTLAGLSVYSTVQYLNDEGAPSPTGRGPWVYSSVERLLRHPILAGMTPYNPGNDSKQRGSDVLRDASGLPVVDERVAILSVADWRRMIALLDDDSDPRRKPRALRSATSGLLSGLVLCAEHDEPQRMHRGTTAGREGFKCPKCHQTITSFEDLVVEEFLAQKGDRLRWRRVEVLLDGGAAVLPEIERRLDELDVLIREANGRAERLALQRQQGELLDRRDEARRETPEVEYVYDGGDQTFAEDWEAASDVEQRRAVLDDALSAVLVRRGGVGRRTREQVLERLTFEWIGEVGPEPVPDETWVADGTFGRHQL